MKVTIEIPKGDICDNCFFSSKDRGFCFLFRRFPYLKKSERKYISTYSSGDMSDNTGYVTYFNTYNKVDECIKQKHDLMFVNGERKNV